MDDEILRRARDWLKKNQLQGALLSNPFNVAWLSGYSPLGIGGPDPFEGGPPLLWLDSDDIVLLIAGLEESSVQVDGLTECTYAGYTVAQPMSPPGHLSAALRNLLRIHMPANGKCGVELNYLPAYLLDVLEEIHPRASWRRIDGLLDPLRAVKTETEIERLRASLALCDLAQATLRPLIHVGSTEIELFAAVQNQIEQKAERPMPLLANLVAGARAAERGGSPTAYQLRQGDLVIFDITLQYDGYWGDNCGTFAVDEVSDELKRIHSVALNALHLAEEIIRPGLRANELDQGVRDFIRQQGYEPHHHHTGHGIGVSYHEAPRIVPYNQEQLQEGMVICLEPGIYLKGIGGVRLEDAVLVVKDGAQVLSRHSKQL